jgi:histidine ammonia-lyase
VARGRGTDRAYRLLRKDIPSYDQDRFLAPDIALVDERLTTGDWLDDINAVIG